MRRTTGALSVALTFTAALVAVTAQQKPAPAKPAAGAGKATKAAVTSDAQIIRKASSAAPAAVSKDATIVAMGDDMNMRTVRKGTNGFTCMVAGPGPDAMCADQNAMAWLDAYMNKKDPPTGKVGFVYMLSGDKGASNTDPYATKADPSNHWVMTGSHVMIVGAKGMTGDYPRAAQADPTKPYVMWAGTPYEHLMLPVK
jgi:hypothetical protein